MTLRQKQSKFAVMLAKLILHAHELGYEVTIGDVYRDPRVHGAWGTKRAYGKAYSLHKLKLAADVNLFKNGHWLKTTAAHRPLGLWWEAQGGSWGGWFNDGNHYSLRHEGYR